VSRSVPQDVAFWAECLLRYQVPLRSGRPADPVQEPVRLELGRDLLRSLLDVCGLAGPREFPTADWAYLLADRASDALSNATALMVAYGWPG
jgi:hypothetical protein